LLNVTGNIKEGIARVDTQNRDAVLKPWRQKNVWHTDIYPASGVEVVGAIGARETEPLR
jgi:hypothetical protein